MQIFFSGFHVNKTFPNCLQFLSLLQFSYAISLVNNLLGGILKGLNFSSRLHSFVYHSISASMTADLRGLPADRLRIGSTAYSYLLHLVYHLFRCIRVKSGFILKVLVLEVEDVITKDCVRSHM